ncbi:MAG: hypothetical protein K0Q72_5390, partial [Armatimonadetes bacterium]|nr:hypothetical protein [Armatimonadota bacterium]
RGGVHLDGNAWSKGFEQDVAAVWGL